MARTLTAAMTTMTVAVALTACGGGGGDPGGTPRPAPQPATPTPQLAGYVGTWVADCEGREQETDVIAQASATSLTITRRIDYYSAAGCGGFTIATQTQSASVTATTTGTADVTLALPPSTTPAAIKVDLFAAAVSPYTVSVTGTGVTRSNVNGKPAWCVNFAPGDARCIVDEGTLPGSSTSAALYVNGNDLYELSSGGLSYTVTQHLTRR